jgi:hypothetical protein
MHTVTGLLHGLAWSAWLATALAAEDLSVPPPMPAEAPSSSSTPAKRPPPPKGPCSNCGVIRSIEQTETERHPREMPSYIGSPQYTEQRDFSKPFVGPVLGITFGKGQSTQTFVGAAGSEAMRQRIMQITYAVTVSFDDGRFGLIEMQAIDDLRVGDRVRVDGSRLEPVKGKE